MTLETAAPVRPNPLKTALLFFTALQVLDFLTTAGVFAKGGFEANPLIKLLMPYAGHPLAAVLIAKTLLVFFAWKVSRHAWIVYAGNALYSLVVLWNALLFASTLR